MASEQVNNEFEQLQNSLELNKKRFSQSIHQSKLQEMSKNITSRRFTVPLEDNSDQMATQRQRLITNHLLKELIPNEAKVDHQAYVQQTKSSLSILRPSWKILLLGVKKHKHLRFYLKAIEECSIQSLQETNELLIQNTLLAGKYINNYGLFCLLKEILAKRNIKMIINEDTQSEQQQTNDNSNKLNKSYSNFSRGLGLQDLNYVNGIVSLIKFKLYINLDLSHYQIYKTTLDKIECQIKSIINLDLLFIAIYEEYVEFTIPELNDNEIQHYLTLIRQNIEYEIESMPLINYFELRISDLYPWQDREINKEWKLFAFQQDETDNFVGYQEFFNKQIYDKIPKTNSIVMKLYGETHSYQMIMRVNKSQTTGILVKEQNI